jgi:aspartate-semialdehyde dehydrogenase
VRIAIVGATGMLGHRGVWELRIFRKATQPLLR